MARDEEKSDRLQGIEGEMAGDDAMEPTAGQSSGGTKLGEVKISTDVVVIIAYNVASTEDGVYEMSPGIGESITQVLGRKNAPKGVKVELSEKSVTIDLYVVVEFGARIPDVSWRIQDKVKTAVESMTGLDVKAINIHVQGVSFEPKNRE